jgi:hypothetical protein
MIPEEETSEAVSVPDKCYLCGCILDDSNYTRDHIPPRGIFAQPLPDNLITVPCCKRENNDNHKADEVFRTLMAMAYKRNPAGDKIWQKVVDRTLPSRRIKAELDAIALTARQISDPEGKPCVEMKVRQRPIKLQLIRMTRGLLAAVYPDINSSNLEWEITAILQFKTMDALMSGVTAMLPYNTRGSGNEFQFWHAIANDVPSSGFWVYLFYNSVCYTVMHQPRTTNYRKHAGIRVKRGVGKLFP